MSKQLQKFIIANAEKCRLNDDKISWKQLGELILAEFPEENIHPERIRSIYRKAKDPKYKAWQKSKDTVIEMKRLQRSIDEEVLVKIKKKYAVSALAENLGVDKETLITTIANLQFKGYAIILWEENGIKFVQLDLRNKKSVEPKEYYLNKKDKQIKFAIFSDSHIGHKQSRIEELRQFIFEAYRQGVTDVFFAGDLVEGHYMSIRPTSIKELDAIGFDDQIDLANNVLPQLKGFTYHMISGNHDGSFDRNAFANPVRTLARERKDINYLGHNFAKVWLNDKIDISLVHPTDGISQSYDLKMKQHIDRAREDKISRFIFMGHYHKFSHTHYKGVDGFIVPAMVGYSHFMDDKNLASIVGAMILTLNIDSNGELISFIPEYFFFNK
jgi:hypothetical protein